MNRGISLALIAAWHGKTKVEYLRSLMRNIKAGRMMDMLSISAQARLADWMENNDCVGDRKFAVSIPLSNDVVLYCMCSINFDGNEPLIMADVSSGMTAIVPRRMRGLPLFQIALCDLEVSHA